MRASNSIPLGDGIIYRPGIRVALAGLLPPVLVALGVIAYARYAVQPLPFWVPAVFLGWLPVLLLLWLAQKTVKVTATGIATGRPLRSLQELPWGTIQHVRHGAFTVTVVALDGSQLRYSPLLLHNADDLQRELVSRLPASVFSIRFGASSTLREMNAHGVPQRLLAQTTLKARPALTLRLLAFLVGLALLSGIPLALTSLHPPLAMTVSGALSIVGLVVLLLARWLSQQVTIDEQGIAVKPLLTRRDREVRWGDMALIEHTAGERLIRARNGTAIRLAGPTLFAGKTRELYRTLVSVYSAERNILTVVVSPLTILAAPTGAVIPHHRRSWSRPLPALRIQVSGADTPSLHKPGDTPPDRSAESSGPLLEAAPATVELVKDEDPGATREVTPLPQLTADLGDETPDDEL